MQKLEDQDIIEAAKTSETMASCLRKLNMKVNSGNYRMMRTHFERLNSTEFKKKYPFKPEVKKINIDEIFVQNSSRCSPRNVVIRYKLLPYTCQLCNMLPSWNGQELTLELDHINGISTDNRLENLRFLCPNCHSQTPTFRSKNAKHKDPKLCTCGIKIDTSSSMCRMCLGNHRTSLQQYTPNYAALPNKDELEKEIAETSVLATAKKYGISDNGLRKHLKRISAPTENRTLVT